MNDLIDRQAAIDGINGLIDRFEKILFDIREANGDDSVCGLCEYDGAFVGESGDWCNECPGFDKEDCFELRADVRKKWLESVELPSAQKRGEWVERQVKPVRSTGIYEVQSAKCSVCGRYHTKPYLYFFDFDNYCPYCGAKMGGS